MINELIAMTSADTGNGTSTEKWYTIVTILLALSLISERVANMIKLYTPALKVKKVLPSDEKDRELGVMWRALISGLLVAILAGADFFRLISDATLVDLAIMKDADFVNLMSIGSGILLSGIFISLGSKFWHDVLDIVLEFSNLKKYQAENLRSSKTETKLLRRQDVVSDIQQKVQIVLPGIKKIKDYAGYEISTDAEGNTFLVIKFHNAGPQFQELAEIYQIFQSSEVKIEVFTDLPAIG